MLFICINFHTNRQIIFLLKAGKGAQVDCGATGRAELTDSFRCGLFTSQPLPGGMNLTESQAAAPEGGRNSEFGIEPELRQVWLK